MKKQKPETETRIADTAQALSLTPEETERKLDEMGLEEEDLDDEAILRFTDFVEVFKGRPIAALRKAFRALKGGRKVEERAPTDDRAAALQALGHKAKLADAGTPALLGLYDPRKGANDPVTRTLQTRYGNQPIIAFRDDGSIAVQESASYVADLERGLIQVTNMTMVDGKLVRLWPVGVVPDTMLEEDPLFPGRALHNGRSQVTYHDWSVVAPRNKQLCRVILQRGEINTDNREAVLRLLERATDNSIAKVYPEADLELRELEKQDNAPKLKVALSQQRKNANPFGIKRSY